MTIEIRDGDAVVAEVVPNCADSHSARCEKKAAIGMAKRMDGQLRSETQSREGGLNSFLHAPSRVGRTVAAREEWG